MSTVAFIRRMLDAGFTHDDALRAAEAFEATASTARALSPRQRANDDKVWVYVIAVDHPGAELTKVGISQHPRARMATLERERGYSLYLAETFGPFSRRLATEIERSAHRQLLDRQEVGEWFWCCADDAVATVRASSSEKAN